MPKKKTDEVQKDLTVGDKVEYIGPGKFLIKTGDKGKVYNVLSDSIVTVQFSKILVETSILDLKKIK